MSVRTLLLAYLALIIVGCKKNEKIPPPPPETSGSTTKDAIGDVLKAAAYIGNKAEDDANWFKMNFRENRLVGTKAISLKGIDTSRCPKDFQDAFHDHVQ